MSNVFLNIALIFNFFPLRSFFSFFKFSSIFCSVKGEVCFVFVCICVKIHLQTFQIMIKMKQFEAFSVAEALSNYK